MSEINAGYKIIDKVMFNNGEGFVMAVNPSGYVTWRFKKEESNNISYFWGHYFDSESKAENDLLSRVSSHMDDMKPIIKIVREVEEQVNIKKYYSVKSIIYDNGKDEMGLDNIIESYKMPRHIFTSEWDKDIYIDWFESKKEADEFIKENLT